MPGCAVCCATACCGGKSVCDAMCFSCARCGCNPKVWPKLWSVIQGIFFMLISLAVLYSLKASAETWDWYECIDPSGDGEISNASSCYGIKAVLVMSFTLFIYHLAIFILILPGMRCSQYVHDSFWCGKFLTIIVLYIAFFFIPHSFYVVWAHICRAGSFLFLIVQGYFLLNAAYTMNDAMLAANDHAGRQKE